MPISIEFKVNNGEQSCREDSITLRSPEELFAYIAPGGDCESIPSEVDEIQLVFLPAEHANTLNPVADSRVMLQMGMVFVSGPLSMIARTAQELLDRSGRGELSPAFLAVAGLRSH